ncbi:MAG: META domain-containing protein [Tannerellaceae bacterium]|jgi:hypothetical protein|nr:META domain-containing protein [Tannerellaceae bacterium]
MKTTKFLLLATLAISMNLACSDNEDLTIKTTQPEKLQKLPEPEPIKEPELIEEAIEIASVKHLIGESWKLVAFVNDTEGTIETPESISENSYWIVFYKNGELRVESSVNDLYGSYKINLATSTISISALGGSKRNELLDGKLFVEKLQSVESFVVEESSLKLYNNEKDYLLFNLNAPESQIEYTMEGYVVDYDGFLERGATTAKAFGYYIMPENKTDTLLTYNMPASFDEFPIAFFNGDGSYRHEKIRITYRLAEESEKVYTVHDAFHLMRYRDPKQIIINSIEQL